MTHLAGDALAAGPGGSKRESVAVCGDGIRVAAALGEQRAAGDVQLGPAGEPGAGSGRVQDCQPGRGPLGVRDGDGGSPR